jgi:hypothetical protein
MDMHRLKGDQTGHLILDCKSGSEAAAYARHACAVSCFHTHSFYYRVYSLKLKTDYNKLTGDVDIKDEIFYLLVITNYLL